MQFTLIIFHSILSSLWKKKKIFLLYLIRWSLHQKHIFSKIAHKFKENNTNILDCLHCVRVYIVAIRIYANIYTADFMRTLICLKLWCKLKFTKTTEYIIFHKVHTLKDNLGGIPKSFKLPRWMPILYFS